MDSALTVAGLFAPPTADEVEFGGRRLLSARCPAAASTPLTHAGSGCTFARMREMKARHPKRGDVHLIGTDRRVIRSLRGKPSERFAQGRRVAAFDSFRATAERRQLEELGLSARALAAKLNVPRTESPAY